MLVLSASFIACQAACQAGVGQDVQEKQSGVCSHFGDFSEDDLRLLDRIYGVLSLPDAVDLPGLNLALKKNKVAWNAAGGNVSAQDAESTLSGVFGGQRCRREVIHIGEPVEPEDGGEEYSVYTYQEVCEEVAADAAIGDGIAFGFDPQLERIPSTEASEVEQRYLALVRTVNYDLSENARAFLYALWLYGRDVSFRFQQYSGVYGDVYCLLF